MNAKYVRPTQRRVKPRLTLRQSLFAGGCAFWLIVVLTHVAERWQIFPGMGWGSPDSPGHYLDLFSAIAGTVLLVAAFFARRFPR